MATLTRFVVPDHVPEKSTWRFSGTMKDDAGTLITLAQLVTLTLTLYNLEDTGYTIINAVNAVDIKNVGRGTVGATDGSLAVKFGPNDAVLIDATKETERHLALIDGTYNAGNDRFHFEVEHVIRNVAKVS